MFDWDDQELANIIWGETSEADDHIVPYPEETEKKDLPNYGDNDRRKLNEEGTNSKAAEQLASTSKPLSDGGKQERNDCPSASRLIVDPELELPSFAASETDNDDIAKKNQLGIGPDISQNQHDDKELGELVGNTWANIGSFDDLDRIFSNDDLDGHTSLGNTDDLWPSSKDLIHGAAKSSSQALGSNSWEFGALENTSAHFDINSEYLHDGNLSLAPGCGKTDAISSYSQRNISGSMEDEEYALAATALVKEKTALGITVKAELHSPPVSDSGVPRSKSTDMENWSNNPSERSDKMTDSRFLRETYDRWPSSAANVPQLDAQCASATVQNYPTSVPSQKRLPQGSSSMTYQRIPNPYAAPFAYGTFTHQHPPMHRSKPPDNDHQPMLSNSEACPGDVMSLNKPLEASGKPVKMTPQEKIEKLRRRQQMRAMLAIQKQQQQFSQKSTSVDHTLSQRSSAEDQIMQMEKSEFEADEGLSTLPCYDPGSPNKRDDSSAISDIDDFSAEDTVLYQLQDVIARLDMKIRMCVRDSLYRLAQSAMHRNYTSDTSRSTKTRTHESDIAKEEINSERFAGKANAETETNHIDRIVAHLLFHRPFKLSVKHAETPESSTSTKVSNELETATPSSLPVGFLSKTSENEYNISRHSPKTSHTFVDSHDKDTLNGIPQREMRINPQMNQKMAEQAD